MNEGGHVVRDLRANIAAEAGALNTYEQLIAITTDDGTRDALRHLATREVSHTHMFMEALRSFERLGLAAVWDFENRRHGKSLLQSFLGSWRR